MDDQLKLIKKINRRTRFTQFLAWLALFFTAVGIAAGYKNWLRIHDKAKLALRQVAEINQEIPNFALQERLAVIEKELNDNFKENKAHLDEAMTELRTIQDSTQYIADSVYIQASEDIAIVNQYAEINVTELSEKIDDLLKQLKPEIKTVEQNPESVELLPSKQTEDTVSDDDTKSAETLVNRVKKTINDAVIIRKFDKPLQEDLDTDSKERLYQLFSLRFETLKIMLLQGDNENFHKQTERIKSLLLNYYSEEKSTGYIEKLNDIDAVNLSPELPDANDSLELLEKIMAEKKIIDEAKIESTENKSSQE